MRTVRPKVVGSRGGRFPGPLTVTALGVLLSGCGIQATEVPTDFGPAPSRVRCAQTGVNGASPPARSVRAQVFLLCDSSLVAVGRTVRSPEDTVDSGQRRAQVAQELLDQLSAPLTAAEKKAGHTTNVRGGTSVSGPRSGDPEDTLRLSVPPESLTPPALAQLVCTFSGPTAGGDGSVVLGGQDDEPPHRYHCTDEVRARPGDAEPPSTDVDDG